ncbi:TorD/DmsD family molecular chaperone [Virgibacillus pantothenticus]|uniref:TorD/DmsD family molecular chaperone n=1 Tax=Virgibacillus pantothenticus TaxID=1473 RepID=UPI000985948E|nr:molecular chaperone TorD family protein [Virgibacillus pantothenticus]
MRSSKAVLDMTEVFYARQFIYDVLRRFFLEEPSRDYLAYFVQEKLIDLFPFVEESEDIQRGITEIKAYLSKHNVIDNDADYEDLHWDYTRLFVGPFDLPAPPWESVYVRKDRLLFQSNTVDVRNVYLHFGYEVEHKNLEAEDHVGLELDFMFHLNELSLKSLNNNGLKSKANFTFLVKEQRRFLEKHLLAFISVFSEKVIENAHTGFFTGMARLLRSYLKMDAAILEELLEMDES